MSIVSTNQQNQMTQTPETRDDLKPLHKRLFRYKSKIKRSNNGNNSNNNRKFNKVKREKTKFQLYQNSGNSAVIQWKSRTSNNRNESYFKVNKTDINSQSSIDN